MKIISPVLVWISYIYICIYVYISNLHNSSRLRTSILVYPHQHKQKVVRFWIVAATGLILQGEMGLKDKHQPVSLSV